MQRAETQSPLRWFAHQQAVARTAQVLEIRVANSHLLCLVTWAVGSYLLQCCSGQVPRSPMVRCTICRGVMLMKSTPWCSRTFTILEIPRVPRSSKSFSACPVKGWGSAVDSSALTGCIPLGRVSARSSFMQRSSWYGSPLESRLFVVKTQHRLLYMRPSGRFSALKTDMYLLRWVLLWKPCVKGVLVWQ